MDLMFIDESKGQEKSKCQLFVLVGVIVNEKHLYSLEEDLRALKKKISVENLKDLKGRTDINLDATKKICEILEKNGAKILSVLLGKNALKSAKALEKAYPEAIEFLVERYALNLKKLADGDGGIIIHDTVDNRKIANELKKFIHTHVLKKEIIMYGYKKGLTKERIYPAIFFSEDDYSEILQVADLVALSLKSAVWHQLRDTSCLDVEKLPKYNQHLACYWQSFIKSQQSKVEGWGVKVWW